MLYVAAALAYSEIITTLDRSVRLLQNMQQDKKNRLHREVDVRTVLIMSTWRPRLRTTALTAGLKGAKALPVPTIKISILESSVSC